MEICFSCSKDLPAERIISRSLANLGIAVLRFDFTGLGSSEGDFADTNFSSNVEDLVAAADYLREHYQAPEILIGHSLGGIFVAYTLIHEYPFISTNPHEISYAFNLPGVSEELFNKWDMIPLTKKPSFKGIISRGDVVSKFGFLFGDLFEVSLKKSLSPIRAHETILFAEPLSYLHAIDLNEENQSHSRQFYSKLHQQTSSMIYDFGLKFLFPK